MSCKAMKRLAEVHAESIQKHIANAALPDGQGLTTNKGKEFREYY